MTNLNPPNHQSNRVSFFPVVIPTNNNTKLAKPQKKTYNLNTKLEESRTMRLSELSVCPLDPCSDLNSSWSSTIAVDEPSSNGNASCISPNTLIESPKICGQQHRRHVWFNENANISYKSDVKSAKARRRLWYSEKEYEKFRQDIISTCRTVLEGGKCDFIVLMEESYSLCCNNCEAKEEEKERLLAEQQEKLSVEFSQETICA